MLRIIGHLILLLSLPLQAFALSFEPASPLVEVNDQIAISVQGAQGEVIWSSNKGRIEDNGNRATFFAPAEDGIATVVAIDGSGQVEKVRVVVITPNEQNNIYSLDNMQWKIYTNQLKITSLALSEEHQTLWVGTDGGIEKRNLETGALIKIYTIADGLPGNYVNAIEADSSGGLWVGTTYGLGYLYNGTWTNFDIGNVSSINLESILIPVY